MNIRRIKLSWSLPLITLHLILLFSGTFFLYPEITLYPYFVSKGLLPYTQIIDQHFPLIFFGPINLSQLGITTPGTGLILFLTLTILTDLFVFNWLNRQNLTFIKKFTIFSVFIALQLLLGNRSFWLENFTLFFLCLALWLTSIKHNQPHLKRNLFLAGISLGMVLGSRPTLLPLLLLFLLFSANRIPLLVGMLLIPALELLWLLTNDLLSPFLTMMIFNSAIYAPLATKLPTFRELIILSLAIFPLIHPITTLSGFLIGFIFILSASATAYPRFELLHLLPLAFVWLILSPKKTLTRYHFLWLLLFVFYFLTQKDFSLPKNFFYPPSLYTKAASLESLIKADLYVFGGPDQLYQLTNTLTPDNLYLPSLPWYHAVPAWSLAQQTALRKTPAATITVNSESRVGDATLLNYAHGVYRYIENNYTPVSNLDSLTVYQ